MLTVATEFREGILFVRLKGHLNKDTIGKLNKRVTNIVKTNGIRNIVFNFTNLKSIDIKGINAILYNYELCKNNDGRRIGLLYQFVSNNFCTYFENNKPHLIKVKEEAKNNNDNNNNYKDKIIINDNNIFGQC